jgi:hypothetical protein
MFATCQFDRRTKSASVRGTLVSPQVWAFSLLVLAFACGSAVASGARNPAGAPVESGPQLAITDFDGDLRPDLARVQAGATTSGGTDYWIQLQLSAAGWQSIRLMGPAGGLQIEARDVNGDHAVDLVLSTPLNQPVAVFLNDGHGIFSRVAPSAYPDSFGKPLTNWASTPGQATDAVGVPPQSGSGVWQGTKAFGRIQSRADSIGLSHEGFAFYFFFVSNAGRAPPA